jgi:hypothetical protein
MDNLPIHDVLNALDARYEVRIIRNDDCEIVMVTHCEGQHVTDDLRIHALLDHVSDLRVMLALPFLSVRNPHRVAGQLIELILQKVMFASGSAASLRVH